MIFLRLFYEFFKTGLFSVGGGMATVPFLQNMSAKTGWFTSGQLADMIAVGESTPGPIGVNMATYVGYTVGHAQGGPLLGVLGAITATLGLAAPSVIIILIIAMFLAKFRDSKYVEGAFYGLRPASVALIASAGVTIVIISFFGCDTIYDIVDCSTVHVGKIILAIALFVATRYIPKVKKWHPIVFILFSALIGVIFRF